MLSANALKTIDGSMKIYQLPPNWEFKTGLELVEYFSQIIYPNSLSLSLT